ncbi:MAG: hypothetical protein LBP60_07990 [Spirochaetaceae bacterium]|jgi:hypothetical protein|nr:hypothetical protein [Spirochaetaceae bacterium]
MKKHAHLFPLILGFLALGGCAKVTGVYITLPPSVVRGGTAQFTAAVEGTGKPRQRVLWELTGASEGSSISEAGLLTVAEDEPALYLTVRAVSAADRNKSAEGAVLLADSLYGPWRNERSNGVLTVTISPGSLDGRYSRDYYYTIEDLSWTMTANEDPATQKEYPLGYLISGTATKVYRIRNLSKGTLYTTSWYLHADGTKALRIQEDGSYIFTRVVEEE